MTGAFWVFLRALFTVIPVLVLAIREGQIKTGTEKEIQDAFTLALSTRAKRALDARDGPDDGMSDGFDRG